MEYPKELHRAETHIYLSREKFLMAMLNYTH